MKAKKAVKINGKTPEMWELANYLVDMAPSKDSFRLPGPEHKSGYIPLSSQKGKRKAHKNAVSIHETHISVMVRDWTIQEEVEKAGFRTGKSTKYGNRLHVFDVQPTQLQDKTNNDLFVRLLTTAELESEARQKTKADKRQK